MPEQKILAVVGATGAQGGGLVRAILADGERRFAARAITRAPDSEKARALAAAGAEVIAADADDPSSLARAFDGAYGAFLVTNFWEHLSPERELQQATAMARATKSAGIAHAVWSTLEDTRLAFPLHDARLKTLQGKYKVPHFDAKGEADAIRHPLPSFAAGEGRYRGVWRVGLLSNILLTMLLRQSAWIGSMRRESGEPRG